MLSITGISILTKPCCGGGEVILLFECMETQDPLWRGSKGLVHSCEKWIFLLSVGGGVGSMYVHCICEPVPMLPITFSLKGQRKPCWITPLETTSLFTAVSQNPKGCIYLQTLPSPFCLSQYNVLWMLATASQVGRCWKAAGGSWAFHVIVSMCSALPNVPGRPEKTGKDPPPRRTWISRNNRLLMVGSWAAVG